MGHFKYSFVTPQLFKATHSIFSWSCDHSILCPSPRDDPLHVTKQFLLDWYNCSWVCTWFLLYKLLFIPLYVLFSLLHHYVNWKKKNLKKKILNCAPLRNFWSYLHIISKNLFATCWLCAKNSLVYGWFGHKTYV